MTLTLDDVRNMRFRMARKSGYEVLEVDEFVDQVEEAFAQLVEENQNLKRQIEALKSTPPAQPAPATEPAAAAPAPVEEPKEAPVAAGERIVVTTSKDASAAVVRLVEMATEQAERLAAEASDEANRIKEDANRAAHQLTTDARTRAERVESEARVNAERMQSDAANRAQQLDREIEDRRSQMFGELEHQRDQLSKAVTDLRGFEARYRSNLTNHLRSQIQAVESGKLEPDDAPALSVAGASSGSTAGEGDPHEQGDDESPTLGGGSRSSDTPRLDALLGEQH